MPLLTKPAASIDEVVGVMTAIEQALPQSDGVWWFNHLYMRVTLSVREAMSGSSAFGDATFLERLDVVFANLYFDALAADKATPGTAPHAWRPLLSSRTTAHVHPLQFALAGMNAHINRDLPFVLYRMGLFNADGTSRKSDHDLVNSVLFDAYDDAAVDSARRFDPSMAPSTAPGSVETSIQSVVLWREEAWRNAERLASATTDAERALIAAQIEQAATLEAQAIKAAYSYGPGQSSADRDAYCAAHHNDA